ncbi:uncharacterized protein PHALS_09764 [Plasmopara halstedii]|uniref:Uncharacterized protein n=1 Tax=Plasmopara halstedii TaxID=4781 RepID=A0A0P1AEZ6_PLAHL|nr:uncharacterized protein PHALS_09764 [Plasmopara halstedii]CEG39522.1 hypothetical protein PHALS_09764 [Plasmopara halstedii]|eukprot:XP_024575891.1 hypothetical protein PHALS_09764 [Plasmopara halstedii]
MGKDKLKRAFHSLCGDYGEFLDDLAQATHPNDERIGLALFKIDEAYAAADGLRQESQQIQRKLLNELLSSCHELESIMLRVDLIERFVGQLLQTMRELEKRMEIMNRVASSVFYPSKSVTNLFRSFSAKHGIPNTPLNNVEWSPVAFDFDTKELMNKLKQTDAREIGVSTSSSLHESAVDAGSQIA